MASLAEKSVQRIDGSEAYYRRTRPRRPNSSLIQSRHRLFVAGRSRFSPFFFQYRRGFFGGRDGRGAGGFVCRLSRCFATPLGEASLCGRRAIHTVTRSCLVATLFYNSPQQHFVVGAHSARLTLTLSATLRAELSLRPPVAVILLA